MKRFSEQLQKKANTVKLQAAEKRELRERLVSYMEYHPLATAVTKSTTSPFHTESFATVKIPFLSLAKWSTAAFTMVLVVIPVLAEQAVPGDMLYSVKVSINEEVRSSLTLSPYQKVEWETERLNRRIAEARLLASEGRLTEAVEVEVAAAVKAHTDTVRAEIEVLRSADAEEATMASIQLTTTLEAQASSLSGIQEEGRSMAMTASTEDIARPTALIASVINASLAETSNGVSSSTLPAYDKLIARVELNTTRAYELLDSFKVSASLEELADMTRRLEDVERAMVEALALRESDDVAARTRLVDVLQRTQKLLVFMTDIRVNRAVALEEILPLVLTLEEKSEMITSYAQKTTSQVDVLRRVIENADADPAVVDKANNTLVVIADLQAQVAATEDFVAKQVLYEEMMVMLSDSISLFGYVPPEVFTEPSTDTASSTDETNSATDILDDGSASSSVELEPALPSVDI